MNSLHKILLTAAALTLTGTASAADTFSSELALPGNSAPLTVSAPAPLPGAALSGGEGPTQDFNQTQREAMLRHNGAKAAAKDWDDEEDVRRVYRPYADYERPGYLITSADFYHESLPAKLAAAAALPSDAYLVVFGETGMNKEALTLAYSTAIPASRIKFITLNDAYDSFWARDGIPVPVLDPQDRLTVVDAMYAKGFEPDRVIAEKFSAGLERHDYYYEGGNFMADHMGTCIMVNHGAHRSIPDSVFIGQYGCVRMIRLPFVDGIGHIDEHVRFISENTVLTDLASYRDALQARGLTVHMLPKPEGPYETYVNSLILGTKAIVPVYGRPTDAQALEVYRRLGFTPTGAPSNRLSNRGRGSVHCITMTYPAVPAPQLLRALNASEL